MNYFRLSVIALFQLILTVSTPLVFSNESAPREALTSNFFSAPLEVSNFEVQGEATAETLEWCSNLVTQTFALLPAEHVTSVHHLILDFDPEARRGLGGDNTIILRCVGMDEKELIGVLVHEVGHVVDTGLLETDTTGTATTYLDRGQIVFDTDPSVPFYSFNWIDSENWLGEKADFVSGYARSNPYEEFAESYAMYVLNGQLFKEYADENPTLRGKYDYLKDVVFSGFEYELPKTTTKGAFERVYDITRLDYDLESLLALRESNDS